MAQWKNTEEIPPYQAQSALQHFHQCAVNLDAWITYLEKMGYEVNVAIDRPVYTPPVPPGVKPRRAYPNPTMVKPAPILSEHDKLKKAKVSVRCKQEVFENIWHSHQCSRKRGHGSTGEYCKQHAKILEGRSHANLSSCETEKTGKAPQEDQVS
jgi:hypothetical protein